MSACTSARRLRLGCVGWLLWLAQAARASPDAAPPALPLLATRLPVPVVTHLPVRHVRSIFHIDKSENKNQVHYAARVDAACRPLGAAPVYAYWQMHERGRDVTEGLLAHEEQAYGLGSPQRVSRANQGGRVELRLRAFPERPVTIELFQRGTQCVARALTRIDRAPAMLQSIYLDIGFLFSLNQAIAHGARLQDGRAVQERLNR